ncbi:hypothetical protein EYF80_031082 [Liparis tanakae]|uniref:Uncharacterized protein n=1 Tax=Liparis tanakae TaxID=230148 RepID=A0A4Z2GYI1_9TELE|nr:hypothetical protein EYF80_031082 [Liparis tanakae]
MYDDITSVYHVSDGSSGALLPSEARRSSLPHRASLPKKASSGAQKHDVSSVKAAVQLKRRDNEVIINGRQAVDQYSPSALHLHNVLVYAVWLLGDYTQQVIFFLVVIKREKVNVTRRSHTGGVVVRAVGDWAGWESGPRRTPLAEVL